MPTPVSYKIKKLIKEGYSQKQAVAIALKLNEQGRLGPRGGLLKKPKKLTLKKQPKSFNSKDPLSGIKFCSK